MGLDNPYLVRRCSTAIGLLDLVGEAQAIQQASAEGLRDLSQDRFINSPITRARS